MRRPIVRWPVVLVIGLIVYLVAMSSRQAPSREAPPDRPEVTVEGSVTYPPQPQRRFLYVGTVTGGQFTDQEFEYLASNFDYVMLAKFHGGFDMRLHHEAAQRLTQLNPSVRVFVYFSTKYAFEKNRRDLLALDPDWYLRDNDGRVIYRARRADEDNPESVPFVDLANPEYRDWALGTLRSWLEAAPYAGVYFDAAEPIGDFGDEVADWRQRLGQRRVDTYNAGMRELLADAERLVGPDREVIFNGIAPNPARGPDRNLELLEITDGADDERFCLDIDGRVHAIEDDLALMSRYEDRRLFFKTNVPDEIDGGTRERLGRFCLGTFLLGWQPGMSYFQFGDDYTADQIGDDIADANVPVGDPVAPFRTEGEVLSRTFTDGEVHVNTGDAPAPVTLDRELMQVEGGTRRGTFRAGDTVIVPPQDALLFLDPDSLVTVGQIGYTSRR